MKTSLLFPMAVFIFCHGVNAKRKKDFKCPESCPANVYRPVCSRGKSYANLCVLQQQICAGKLERGIYDDFEKCPNYDKDEDTKGASVETIDANGVIFRRFGDDEDKRESEVGAERRMRDKHNREVADKKSEQVKSVLICARPCSKRKFRRPLCIQDVAISNITRVISNLLCKSYSPIVVVRGSHENSVKKMIDGIGMQEPLNIWLKKFDVVPASNYTKNRAPDAPIIIRKRRCKIDCDPNEYRPVCAGGRTFNNECYLRKHVCTGAVDKDLLKIAKPCERVETNGNEENPEYDVKRSRAEE